MRRSSQRAVLICVDPWTLDECEMRPFSYAIRKVQAAAVGDPALSHWDIDVLDLRTTSIDEFLPRIEALEPDLLGVSAYCWSFPTFVELARRLKAKRPNLSIIFGGPSARTEMFQLEPFRDAAESIDALVVGEGEDTFRHILSLDDRSRSTLSEVPGLAVSTGTGWANTAPRPLPDLDSLASPYVLELIGRGTDARASAHLETFRGCPFSCSFCQWGDLSGKSNRAFSTEYLIRELAAFQRLNLRNTLIIDAALNLNQRAFRSLVAAEREVGFFKNTHVLTEVYPAHITDEHLKFLSDAQEVTTAIGVQSLDKEVLDGVERPFKESRLRRVVQDLLSIAPRTTIELIVGLPGDTPTRFRNTLDRCFELGCGVRVYRCLVLPGALMSRAPASFQMDYDLQTLRMRSCLGWSREELEGTLRDLTDLVAAAPGEEAAIFDSGNTWAFNPPAVHACDWRPNSKAIAPIEIGGERLPDERSLPPSPERSASAVEPAAEDLAQVLPAAGEETGDSSPAVAHPIGEEVGGAGAIAGDKSEEAPLGVQITGRMRTLMELSVEEATSGSWKLEHAAKLADRLRLQIRTSNRQIRAIEVCPARRGTAAFRIIEGVAFSYLDNGTPLSKSDQRHFEATASRLQRIIAFTARLAHRGPPSD